MIRIVSYSCANANVALRLRHATRADETAPATHVAEVGNRQQPVSSTQSCCTRGTPPEGLGLDQRTYPRSRLVSTGMSDVFHGHHSRQHRLVI